MSTTNVKYQVTVTQKALLVQVYVPIAPTAMRPEDIERFNAVCASAQTLLQAERDAIAAELQAKGVCPWCNTLTPATGNHTCG